MIDYTAPIFIMLINSYILFDLTRAAIWYKRNGFSRSNAYDSIILLIIANTFAFITGFIDYFIIHSTVVDVLQFGRFADRYVMLFAYMKLINAKNELK